ncbi:AlpA family phage regulatory protein [Aliifodinibius sp. S!AR15-10]|uniref:helix-turn-helix transcriptional regulator n=1 Tax=Aliifodinibius sp. S!AR15-10 TaxID=2950437 RepID=UPI00285C9315|nr:AlpA family phage regulatory protein [Aliifodinibius sp. S!AR15-10]MDR8393792.1 AlpA family phage regulatory protein [Aliifodinibius sp. S!AR15-10]
MSTLQIVRPKQLAELLSVSTVTIWHMEKRGELPRRKQIFTRTVGWLESEIREWLQQRPLVQSVDQMDEI